MTTRTGSLYFLAKGEVPLVVGRHGHDGAGAVAPDDIIRDPHRYRLAVKLVGDISPGEHAVFFPLGGQPVDLVQSAGFVDVGGHRFFLLGGGDLFDQRVLRSQHHEGHPVDGIGAGGEDLDLLFFNTRGVQGELDLGAFGFAHPVALHGLDTFRPVQAGVVFQFFGVFGDLEEPLHEVLADDLGVASPALAAAQDLLVGQDRLARRAPVDRGLGAVGQAGLVQLQEEPFSPLVVIRPAGYHFAVPVVAAAHGLELLAHVFDIFFGPDPGVDAALDGGVLCREAEGVEAHGMHYVVALHPLEAGVDIGRGHGVPVADMEVARGVGEHGQGVPLGFRRLVRSAVKVISSPFGLPFIFDFPGLVPVDHLRLLRLAMYHVILTPDCGRFK